jgi:sulfur carrier protein ThiS
MSKTLIEIKYRILPEMSEGTVKLRSPPKVSDLLKAIGTDHYSVIVTVNGEVVAEDHILGNSDKIVIYRVVSGG